MATRHTQAPIPAGRLPTIGVLVAAGAFLFSFFAQALAVLLALAALVIGAIVLVRARGQRPGRNAGIGTIVVAVLALVIAASTSPAPPAPQGRPATAPVAPVVDPNALPATVTIASAQSPADLLTTTRRRLHVTAMQGRPAPTACDAASYGNVAGELVVGRQVQVAAPHAAYSDVPAAVPGGFQPVVLSLPDGRDYDQAWSTEAVPAAAASCTTTTTEPPPTTTTEEPAPTRTVEEEPDVDVDRPYVPDPPRPRARSGHSGHPCLPSERDGDGDGYCGE